MSQAMTGDGDYDHHSDYQVRGAKSHVRLIEEAVDKFERDSERESMVIADYGSAQGRVSMIMIRAAIERLRARRPDIPVFVYHNDLLANDWAALFERLRGEDTYLDVGGGPITPLVSATSFYEASTPSGIVDLGVSFAAIQWLAKPGPAGNGSALYFDQLQSVAKADMAAEAHIDWTLFLERRVEELAQGGRLVMDMMGRSDDGPAAGHKAWQMVRTIAEGLVAEGVLGQARLDAYVIPIYERSIEEVERPFREALGKRLRLEHLSLAAVKNPALERFQRGGDALTFAHEFVAFFRAFSEPSLRAALDPDGEAIDELYRRLETRLRDDAATFSFTVHIVSVVAALI